MPLAVGDAGGDTDAGGATLIDEAVFMGSIIISLRASVLGDVGDNDQRNEEDCNQEGAHFLDKFRSILFRSRC